MKIPRDLNYQDIIKILSPLGYSVTRQSGSHIRLTTEQNGVHHITIPAHRPVKIGTLNSIIVSIAEHFGYTKNELMEKLFSR
ncbi:MAG TPA: type II toxin-antitoxin system HicA family toxin [Spirochaetota bacterium]|nr:type II toxin-antitoxin system HicA family toxin [Spirochaetota bacterium]